MLKFFAGLTLGVVLICAGYALAARSSGGTFTLYTPGNPVVTGTTISSSWANNTLVDIGTEITDSLSRSGKGPMLAKLQLKSLLSVNTPDLTWDNDNNSGLYRIANNDFGFAVNQNKIIEITANGLLTANGAAATPSFSFFNETNTGFYRGSAGIIRTAIAGVDALATGQVSGNFYGLWFKGAISSPAATNVTLTSDGNTTQINATTGNSIVFTVNNSASIVTVNSSGLAVNSGTTTIGATNSSAISNLKVGSCTLDGNIPSHCTVAPTVPSGSNCVCSTKSSVGGASGHGCEASVSGTTLTITGADSAAVGVAYFCAN